MSHERLFHNAGKQTFKLSIISVPYPLFFPFVELFEIWFILVWDTMNVFRKSSHHA